MLSVISLGFYTLGVIGGVLQWFSHVITVKNLVGPDDTAEKAFLHNIISALVTVSFLPLLLVVASLLLTVFLCFQLVHVTRTSQAPADPKPSASAREQGKTAVALLDETVGSAHRWTHELNSYLARLPTIPDAKSLTEQLDAFVNARWADAEQWLALPKERLRYSVWLANEQNLRLGFAFGNADIAKDKDYFNYGDGLAGMVFANPSREPFNEINPTKHPKWKRLTRKSSFQAILIVLVEFGDDHRLGVLNVTRKRSEKFDPSAVRMIAMLGCIIGTAIGLTERRAVLLRTSQLPQPTQ